MGSGDQPAPRDDDVEPASRFEADVEYCMANAVEVPLPDIFRPSFGLAFGSCLMCRATFWPPTPETGNIRKWWTGPYVIVKELHGGEPWVEYALCAVCLERLLDSYPPVCRERLDALFEDNIDFRSRFDELTGRGAPVSSWLEKCILSGDDAQAGPASQICGLARHGKLLLSVMPYAIAGRGLDRFRACFDDEGHALINDFVRRYLGVDSIIHGG